MAVAKEDFAGQPSGEEALVFTTHELAYLLELAPGKSADVAKERLKLALPEDGAAFLAAGASTLIVRELATVDGDLLSPSGAAGLIGMALTSAAVWVEIAFLSERETDAAFVVFSPHITMAITPRAIGTFEFRFIKPGVSPGQATAALLLTFLIARAPAAAYARIVEGGPDFAVALRLLEDGLLEYSRDEGQDLVSGTLTNDRERIERLVAEQIDRNDSDVP